MEMYLNTYIKLRKMPNKDFSLGQRHIILTRIDAHYKWPQNKIYSHVS